MATIHTCDCGKQKPMSPDDLVFMVSRLYCKGDCEEKVQKYLDSVDALHDKVEKTWSDGMKKLNSKDFLYPYDFG